MLKHNEFIYHQDIPENLIKNQASFTYYFNQKNKSKQIMLNSKEIFNTETMLSDLLNHLISFHNNLLKSGDKITIESILQL